jgi:hypothetical protein
MNTENVNGYFIIKEQSFFDKMRLRQSRIVIKKNLLFVFEKRILTLEYTDNQS